MERAVNYIRYIIIFIFLSLSLAQDDTLVVKTPEIAKSQESEIVSISVLVNEIDTAPTAYRFSVYARSHAAEPFMQKLFFPGEPIQIVLPINILSNDSLGNIAKLEPLGDKYSIQYRMFNKREKEIILTSFQILIPADLLKLSIMDEESGKPIINSKIEIIQDGVLLSYASSDSLGHTRLRIPLKRDKDIPIIISIDTNGQFQLYKRELKIEEGSSEKIIMLSSIKLEVGETIYQVINDLVPFREGPENGSTVLFLLNSGDQVIVSKVAGDRLFGRVKVFLESQGKYKNLNGWILDKYVNIKDEYLKF